MKWIALGVCAAVAALATAGCGGADGSNGVLLGIVSISPAEANNARFIKGAEAAAQAKGWKTLVIDAHGSADEANAAMTNLAQRKAGAIVDMVFPTSALGAGLAAARRAGIPVATWGGSLGPDNVLVETGAGGPLAASTLKQMLADMGGTGSVLALTYRGGEVCRTREQVFDETLKDYPDIKITKQEVRIPGYLQDGANFASSWLGQHPKGAEPLAIWGCWDDPTIGALSAVRQQGRSDVKSYGQNGNAAAIAAIQNGEMTATTWEDSVQEGKALVDAIGQAKDAGASWKPTSIAVPGVLVTQATVQSFLAEHPDAVR